MAETPSKIPPKSKDEEAGNSFGKVSTADITERDKVYEITTELPGVTKDNLDVRFCDGVLTVKGEMQEEKEHKEKNYSVSERRFASFERSFRVPGGVDVDKIEASFEDGVLTIVLPKSARSKAHEKKIAIGKRRPSRNRG